jgi:LPS-assembly protein
MPKAELRNSKKSYPLWGVWILAFLCFFSFSYLIFCFAQEYVEERDRVRKKIAESKQDLIFDDTTKDPFRMNALAAELIKKASAATQKIEAEREPPIDISGDKIEYSTDSRNVTITGHAQVIYKGSTLTCDKLTINTATKSGVAQGNARLDEAQGIIQGDKLVYNFETKSGTIFDAGFRSAPYYGKAEKLEKLGDEQYVTRRNYLTTCNFDHPHYRLGMRQMNFFPGNKMQTKGATFYLGGIPILYMPAYEHKFRDPLAHVQVTPGSRKQWGQYMLTEWQYNLAENVSGRMYLDFRQKLGFSEGFGVNFNNSKIGKGDFKFYYTHEKTDEFKEGFDSEFERYLIRWRHKWDIDENTNLMSQYYYIKDSKMATRGSNYNFLKDYFYREYELDGQPPSYVSLHRSFGFSSFDLTIQKRTNRWYNPGYLEKLPEAKFTLPSTQLGDSRFYFENRTSGVNYNLKNQSTMTPAANDTNPNKHYNRLDSYNKISYAGKLAFIEFTPFVANEETFYSKDVDGENIAPRTIFFSGADMSTRFYRNFDVKTKFAGMEINGLRHIITPSIRYSFNHEPTVSSSHLRQIDPLDSMTRNNGVAIELSNKLQTKRNNVKVDIVDFRVNSVYYFKPKYSAKRGSNLSDIIYHLDIIPTTWMRLIADATYNRSVPQSDPNYCKFTTVNYDMNFDLAGKGAFGIGQRYVRKGSNQITSSFNWRLSPKWKFSIYERYEMGSDPSIVRGLKEQEYTLSRDLHCWQMDVTYNISQEQGHSIWFIFRLKAFPEMEFNFNQSYSKPKPGSQSNP